MPAPMIPGGLRPEVASYSYEGPGGVRATEVAGGIPRVAMQYDRGVQAFRVSLKNKLDEHAAWTTFYHRVIRKGSLPFQMTLDSGYGPALHTVQMIPGTYTAAKMANRVDTAVSFGVWAESQAYAMTDEEVQDLLDFFEVYGAGSSAFLARLERFVLQDMQVLEP